ncbi:hypothetical protein [Geminocystis sp. GBBB08]|uniref:hypothetical protein n=1 Tax=Geminocystis sp. GBBB08 TaxID=2604140 RepID=UPI0027E218B0|nr:hypothetical protein [Geminocystis sp. GBBB08]MBL1209290.1 hypothetical protein [Geminocystis sp. GBBB08]
MKTPLMGGKSTINILIQGDDVVNSLRFLPSNHQNNLTFLEELITEKYQDKFKLKIHSQIGDRSDILLQKINNFIHPNSPSNKSEVSLIPPLVKGDKRGIKEENLQTIFCEEQQLKELDIIVFSILPEIQQTVYQHRETG